MLRSLLALLVLSASASFAQPVNPYKLFPAPVVVRVETTKEVPAQEPWTKTMLPILGGVVTALGSIYLTNWNNQKSNAEMRRFTEDENSLARKQEEVRWRRQRKSELLTENLMEIMKEMRMIHTSAFMWAFKKKQLNSLDPGEAMIGVVMRAMEEDRENMHVHISSLLLMSGACSLIFPDSLNQLTGQTVNVLTALPGELTAAVGHDDVIDRALKHIRAFGGAARAELDLNK